ncbi:unnamed protein product [Chilo suppressalis]|uniref:Lipase domain-containing protein n=1 Tax=Chilo suppressalis TaxID=168631 RepID=A0ABN8EAX1_CHISP|nr:unnamed protein product [Chilo suppressalis]
MVHTVRTNIKMYCILLNLVVCLTAVSAISIPDPIILTQAEDIPEPISIQDFWLNLGRSLRFDPARDNQYHLFTRANPTTSQPLVQGLPNLLSQSNYSTRRQTVIVIHGRYGNSGDHFNRVVIPAILQADDRNVITVDWRIGANAPSPQVIHQGVHSARFVAGFVNWLMSVTGHNANAFTVVGFSLGGLKAGLVARQIQGQVSFMMALDPLHRPDLPANIRPDDAQYTETIRTAVGDMGNQPAAHVDFYVNGGYNNPGCGNDFECNHARAYLFYAESLTRGGFTGRQCPSLQNAFTGNCFMPNTLRMGGLNPKTGARGLFHLTTNANSPFSRG